MTTPRHGPRAGADRSDGAGISVVVPTLNAGGGFAHLCRQLAREASGSGVEVVIIDSGSSDGTPEAAAAAGFRLVRIAPEEFGHGRTRNLGVRETSGDVVCFLTQDVLPVTPGWPLRFARALDRPRVAGVFGRQIPRDAATMEMFFVASNYPAEPRIYDRRAALPRPGRVVFSNAFSAIRRDAWERHPFPEDLPVSEDQAWAEAVLAQEALIAYEPAAEALHAHRYSLRALYHRHYLLARALRLRRLDAALGLREGLGVLAREIRYFVHHGHVIRLPYLLVYELVRFLGLQAGRWSVRGADSGSRPSLAESAG